MTLITGTLIGIIVLGALFLISDTAAAALPRFIIPALFLGIAFGAYKQFQEPIVNEAKSQGATFYTWRPLLILVISTAIIIGLIIGAVKYFADHGGVSFSDMLSFMTPKPQLAAKQYENDREKIIANDEEALRLVHSAQNQSHEVILQRLNKSLALYQTNKQLISQLGSDPILPSPYLKEKARRVQYTDLRIEMMQLFLKAETEQSNVYDTRLDDINNQIDALKNASE